MALLISALAVLTRRSLSACSDRSTDGFAIINRSDIEVTVVFVDAFEEVTVEPGHREVVSTEGCIGTSVVVEMAGESDETFEGSACTGSVLYVDEDRTLDFQSMYA